MKKVIVSSLVMLAIVISSCKKKETPAPDPTPTPTPTSVDTTKVDATAPSTYTQKVLLEELTGAWCGWCVDGAVRLEDLVTNNQGKVIGVAIHNGDGMQINPFYSNISTAFGSFAFPNGMVNRTAQGSSVAFSRSLWAGYTTTALAKTAKCGLAFDGAAVSSNSVTISIHTSYNEALSGNYNLTVYLVESEITGSGSAYDQHNYYSNNSSYPTHPFYSQPSVITGYHHNNVVRKVVTASLGDAIPAASLVIGGTYNVSYNVDLTPYNVSNLKVVAFISKVGTTKLTHEVMNVQQAVFANNRLIKKNWD